MVVHCVKGTNFELVMVKGVGSEAEARPTLSATAWPPVAAGAPVAPPAIRLLTSGPPTMRFNFLGAGLSRTGSNEPEKASLALPSYWSHTRNFVGRTPVCIPHKHTHRRAYMGDCKKQPAQKKQKTKNKKTKNNQRGLRLQEHAASPVRRALPFAALTHVRCLRPLPACLPCSC